MLLKPISNVPIHLKRDWIRTSYRGVCKSPYLIKIHFYFLNKCKKAYCFKQLFTYYELFY